MLAKTWIFKISFQTILNIFVVIIVTIVLFGLGFTVRKQGQDDIANRWCAAFNSMYESGYVVEDEIFCTMIVRFPLTPALEQEQKDSS